MIPCTVMRCPGSACAEGEELGWACMRLDARVGAWIHQWGCRAAEVPQMRGSRMLACAVMPGADQAACSPCCASGRTTRLKHRPKVASGSLSVHGG